MATGKGVVIADIDFGFRLTHRDLVPNVDLSHAYNACDGTKYVSHGKSIGHGTGVGIAGGP